MGDNEASWAVTRVGDRKDNMNWGRTFNNRWELKIPQFGMTQSGGKDMTQGGHEEKPMGMDKQGKQDQLTRGENDEEGKLINLERRVTRLER